MPEQTQQRRRLCPGRYVADAHALTGEEISTAMRRLGMTTHDVADAFGVYPMVAQRWELGIRTAPMEVVAALWEWMDEQDQEIERQAARLSRLTEPDFVIHRGGMNGHPFGWWDYIACQLPEELDVRIVHVD